MPNIFLTLSALPRFLPLLLAVLVFSALAGAAGSPHGPLKASCFDCHDRTDPEKIRPDVTFRHDSTRFPLTGAHRTPGCRACHPELKFRGTPRECSRCHADIHNGQFGADCARCHETVTFARVNDFSGFHDQTRFPLRGTHRQVACADCHVRGGKEQWKGINTACASCHINDYRAATSPDHAASGFPEDCTRCHTFASWAAPAFDHAGTRFPLTGAHRTVFCERCHTGNVYAGLHSACNDCHSADFQNAASPSHTTAGFSRSCETCHTTGAWIPSQYNHASTGFALTGTHLIISCTACHKNNVYAGTRSVCSACHEDAYTTAANPNHVSQQLSRDCAKCHTAEGWAPSSFNHGTTAFPLAGAHLKTDCVKCHTTQNPVRPPTACYNCHSADYGRAKDHTLSQFPRDCTQCHSFTAWKPSTFAHSEFKIYSGEHKGKWQSCTDCHTIPGNFAQYSCTKCHRDGRGDD